MTMKTHIQQHTNNMKKLAFAVFASCLLSTAAQGGVLSVPVKIAGKLFGRRAGGVTTRVVTHYGDDVARAATHYGDDVAKAATHYGDDAAKALVKGGGEVVLRRAPKVASAVDAAVAAAKAESVAAKPLSKAAAVLAEVKPKHVLAAGASVAAVVGANNFTSGSREIGKATAEAIRTNPDIASHQIEATGSWTTELAREIGKGVEYIWMGIGGFFGLAGIGLLLKMALPPILNRKRRNDAQKESVAEAA